MSDFIDQFLKEKAIRDDARDKAREWTLYCHGLILARGPYLWEDVVAECDKAVRQWKELNHQNIQQCGVQFAKSKLSFHVSRTTLPVITIAVFVDFAAETIIVKWSRCAERNSEPQMTTQRLPFFVDDDGEVYLRVDGKILNPPSYVAEFLLAPFLKQN